ncbi:hypothetical protein [Brucella pseudogrignonensis]|uniref:Uncharacterized protein n=1 Tax=Brucella pseudogrignonensis TaxID=419475 RepID=A0ABU1M4Z0_9HYPH|nr:hypothetical protein [Brucella pseudogrignonensis]MDR6431113.1 hypothetical protein [Brucella pseudogrignonensis]
MIKKWNKPGNDGCNGHLNDPAARHWSTKWVRTSVFGAIAFVLAVGGGVYTTFENLTEKSQQSNSKLASLFKKPLVMQPLPEMPSESPPGMSVQPERLSPQDALTIQKVDPIITGPRTHKPRPIVERAASKDS